jgi:hypothetical protein
VERAALINPTYDYKDIHEDRTGQPPPKPPTR